MPQTLGTGPPAPRPSRDRFCSHISTARWTAAPGTGGYLDHVQPLRQRPLDVCLVVWAIVDVVALAASDNNGRYAAGALAAAAALVLLLRRRQPLAVSIAAFALLAGRLAVAPQSPNVQIFGLLATFAIVGAINSTRDGITAGLSGAALIVAAGAVGGSDGWVGDVVLTLGFCTVMWVAGWLVSRHTRRADVMALRARAAEQEREIALRDERSRIARELHDVVSHGLSVVVLQTLAARASVSDNDLDGLARHLDAVEASARESLAEMRRMLGLLQVEDFDEAGAYDPTPGLQQVPSLLERARDAGLIVDDAGVDLSRQLPSGVELALYRVIQEALTNAAKYAPGSHVRVHVAMRSGEAVVEVTDNGHSDIASDPVELGGSGRGLIGMRERMAAVCGQPRDWTNREGGYRVVGRLPLNAAPDAATADPLR